MKKSTIDNFNEYINKGKKIVNYAFEKVAENVISNERAIGFNDAIEIGIEKTIASLYMANIKNEDIRIIVNKQWGILGTEIDERLKNIKITTTISSLEEYLAKQGYCEDTIFQMLRQKNVKARIRREKELWELKDKPEKLYKIFFEN